MLHHLEPYLLAPSALTRTALLERAAALLTDPAVAAAVAGDDPVVTIRRNPLYEAVVLRWSVGTDTEPHTHVGTHGAVAVLRGVFHERVAAVDGVRERLLTAGEPLAYGPDYAHQLTPLAGDQPVTLHLTSPPRSDGCLRPIPDSPLTPVAR